MLRYPLIILRRSQRICDNRSRRERFQDSPPARAALLIIGCKAIKDSAVDVQNTNNLIVYFQRKDDFSIARAVAGDVPVERVNVIHTLHSGLAPLQYRTRRARPEYAHRQACLEGPKY